MDISITLPGRVGQQAETKTMKVWATTEALHKDLKHPTAGAFTMPWPEPTEWPDDTYTYRRLQDGDISDHDPSELKLSAPQQADHVVSPPPASAPTEQVQPQPQPQSKAERAKKE